MTDQRKPQVTQPDWEAGDQFELMRLSSPFGDTVASLHFLWIRHSAVLLALGVVLAITALPLAKLAHADTGAMIVLAVGSGLVIATCLALPEGAGNGVASPAFIRAAIHHARPLAARQLVEQFAERLASGLGRALGRGEVVRAFRQVSRSADPRRLRSLERAERLARAQRVTISLYRSVG